MGNTWHWRGSDLEPLSDGYVLRQYTLSTSSSLDPGYQICTSCDLLLKENVKFWEEVKNNLWALSLYYASVDEHQIKKSSLESMALQMPWYSKYGM